MSPNTQSIAPFISLVAFRQFLYHAVIPLEGVRDYRGEPMSKMMPYWRKRGLVPFIPVGKHQVEVSCSDIIWLRILDILRQFSYPIEKQLKVCDYFFRDAYNDRLPEVIFRHNQQLLQKKKRAGTLSERERQTLDYIEANLKNEVLLYALRFELNYLTNLVTDCLEGGEERGLLIFWDGRVGEHQPGGHQTHSAFEVDPLEPHLYISITHLIGEFIADEALSDLILPQILSDDEKTVLRALKEKNLRELTIYMQDGGIRRMESTKGGVLTGAEAQAIRQMLGLKNYERITLDTMDEKSLSFKKTKKKLK